MIPIPLLQQREIEAKVVGPLFRAFAKEVGEARAREILADVVKELARQSGCAAAAALGGNGMNELAQAIENWRKGEALEFDILRCDNEALEFNVTRCRFAEMYRAIGLEDLGGLLSCNRDGAMIEGFNQAIEFQRTQTLMEGAAHCDFRFRRPLSDGRNSA